MKLAESAPRQLPPRARADEDALALHLSLLIVTLGRDATAASRRSQADTRGRTSEIGKLFSRRPQSPLSGPRTTTTGGLRCPSVEAHITGTVWKIEVEVGDSVEEGDTVVILESMKMEMPVEAEDPGVVKEILVQGGPVGLRGRHARCPRVAPGRLLVDEPAPGRCPADDLQPEQARRARPRHPRRVRLHAARARRSLPDHHRRAEDVLGRLRHRRPARRRCSPTRPSGWWPTPSRPRSTRSRPIPTRPWPRSTATRSAAGWSSRWPAI